MKLFIFTPLVLAAMLLFSSAAKATATGPEGTGSSTDCCTMTSRLDYRFFENRAREGRFTLALERTQTEPAGIRILDEQGTQVYSDQVQEATLVRTFDLRPLKAGRYTLEITSGTQMRREPIQVK